MKSHELAKKLLEGENVEVLIPIAYRFIYGSNYENIEEVIMREDATDKPEKYLFLEGKSKTDIPKIDPKYIIK